MKKAIAILLLLALAASTALAMEQDRAIELVKLADDKALGARQFWVEPSGDADGAWVFYATGGKIPYFQGAFWYVDEDQAIPLGTSGAVWSWRLLRTSPEVYTAALGKPDSRRVSACTLVDGKPAIIEDARALSSLEWPGHGNALYTSRAGSYDYAFLRLEGTRLLEVAAVPISGADFQTFPGAQDILDELAAEGYLPTEYLYRSDGVIAINLVTDQDSEVRRLYVYVDRDALSDDLEDADGELVFTNLLDDEEPQVLNPERGWTSELALFEGAAKARYNIGLEVVTSDPFVPYDG